MAVELQEKPVSKNQNGGSNNNPEYYSKKKWGRVAFAATMEMVIILGVWYNVNFGNSEPDTNQEKNNKAIPTVSVRQPCDTSSDTVGSSNDKLPNCEVVKKNFDLKAWLKRTKTTKISKDFMDVVSGEDPMKKDNSTYKDAFVPDLPDAPTVIDYLPGYSKGKRHPVGVGGGKTVGIYVHGFEQAIKTGGTEYFYTKGVQKKDLTAEIQYDLITEAEMLKVSIKESFKKAGYPMEEADLNSLVQMVKTENFYGIKMYFLGESLYDKFNSGEITPEQLGQYLAQGLDLHEKINREMKGTSEDMQLNNFVLKKDKETGEEFLFAIDFFHYKKYGSETDFDSIVTGTMFKLIYNSLNKNNPVNPELVKEKYGEVLNTILHSLLESEDQGPVKHGAMIAIKREKSIRKIE